jgi:hypothetical protein
MKKVVNFLGLCNFFKIFPYKKDWSIIQTIISTFFKANNYNHTQSLHNYEISSSNLNESV